MRYRYFDSFLKNCKVLDDLPSKGTIWLEVRIMRIRSPYRERVASQMINWWWNLAIKECWHSLDGCLFNLSPQLCAVSDSSFILRRLFSSDSSQSLPHPLSFLLLPFFSPTFSLPPHNSTSSRWFDFPRLTRRRVFCFEGLGSHRLQALAYMGTRPPVSTWAPIDWIDILTRKRRTLCLFLSLFSIFFLLSFYLRLFFSYFLVLLLY